jgi:2-polyprenyl-6-methoxyphenol hydroxylase-like FAD-dependent oxidoreductase
VRFVGRDGRKRGGFDVSIFGRVTHESVAAVDEHDKGVRVTFAHARSCDADLVIGADGLHSRVRHLAFGADSQFITSLGYHVAAFEVEGYRPRDELVYVSHGLPGRQISRFAMRDDTTLFLFVLRDEYMRAGEPKSILREAFAGSGWEWPQIERELGGQEDGRHVLAGELHACGGDFRAAFARYEQRLMPFLRRKQASAATFASSFTPKTSCGITFRNVVTTLMRVPSIAERFIGRELRDDIELPDYGFARP